MNLATNRIGIVYTRSNLPILSNTASLWVAVSRHSCPPACQTKSLTRNPASLTFFPPSWTLGTTTAQVWGMYGECMGEVWCYYGILEESLHCPVLRQPHPPSFHCQAAIAQPRSRSRLQGRGEIFCFGSCETSSSRPSPKPRAAVNRWRSGRRYSGAHPAHLMPRQTATGA